MSRMLHDFSVPMWPGSSGECCISVKFPFCHEKTLSREILYKCDHNLHLVAVWWCLIWIMNGNGDAGFGSWIISADELYACPHFSVRNLAHIISADGFGVGEINITVEYFVTRSDPYYLSVVSNVEFWLIGATPPHRSTVIFAFRGDHSKVYSCRNRSIRNTSIYNSACKANKVEPHQ
jgi:hypothetical protein